MMERTTRLWAVSAADRVLPGVKRRTVLVESDFPLFRAGLRAALARLPEVDVVGGEEDHRATPVPYIDVALMCCLGAGGELATRVERLAAAYPEVRVIVVAPEPAPPFIGDLLVSGVAGYLPLTADGDTVVLAMRAVLGGQRVLLGGLAPPEEGPTPRERQVLGLVAEGCSNGEIARILGIGARTVQFHVSGLFGKASARSRTHLVRLARARGWL